MTRRVVALAGVVALALLATGCTPGGTVNEDLTVEDAKSIAQTMERDLAALVPEEFVTEVVQNDTGVLMKCDDDGAYQWTGQTRVYVTDGVDAAAVVAAASDQFSGSADFRVEEDTTADGEPRAHIIGEGGEGYLLSRSVDGTYVGVSSFSPCFLLPDDVSPRGDF